MQVIFMQSFQTAQNSKGVFMIGFRGE